MINVENDYMMIRIRRWGGRKGNAWSSSSKKKLLPILILEYKKCIQIRIFSSDRVDWWSNDRVWKWNDLIVRLRERKVFALFSSSSSAVEECSQLGWVEWSGVKLLFYLYRSVARLLLDLDRVSVSDIISPTHINTWIYLHISLSHLPASYDLKQYNFCAHLWWFMDFRRRQVKRNDDISSARQLWSWSKNKLPSSHRLILISSHLMSSLPLSCA